MNNSKDYRYQLESKKLTGKRVVKTACPSCGQRKCFVRYVDTKNGFEYLDDEVGKCDHQHSCGYHYTPGEYFREKMGKGWEAAAVAQQHSEQQLPPRPLEPLEPQLVTRSHSSRSTFWQWLAGDCARQLGLATEAVGRVYDDYAIGATRQSDVIFWQIDERWRVRGGHIMQYGQDGHRLGYQGWTHIPLIREGRLPLDWQLYQCLFGQHLLPLRRDAHVCLVESEKTALILAAHRPDLLWLATCGSGGLTAEKVACLRGRRVTLFPDSGCYRKWCDVMATTVGISYAVTDRLEAYAPNTDLADVLLGVAVPAG